MSKSKIVMIAASFLAAALTASLAQQPPSDVRGEVIAVEQHVRTQNGGEFDRIRIRTRQGEEMNLRLGAGGSCDGCVAVGDRVRARLMKGGADGEHAVRRMKNQSTGDAYTFRNRSGSLVQTRGRAQRGAGGQGDAIRSRDRVRDPSSGCAGAGSGRGARGGGGRGR